MRSISYRLPGIRSILALTKTVQTLRNQFICDLIESSTPKAASPLSHRYISTESRPEMTMSTDHGSESGDTREKVHVHHDLSRRMMTISFEGRVGGLSRSFNLYRKIDESVKECLERILLNYRKLASRKKKAIDSALVPTVDISLKLNGQPIEPDTKNIDAWIEGTTLEVGSDVYEVATNEPKVVNITLPRRILSGFAVVPGVVVQNCEFEDCKFTWFRQILPQELKKLRADSDFDETRLNFNPKQSWYKLCEGFIYFPTEDDIGLQLKVTCKPVLGSREGSQSSAYSPSSVEIGPGRCPFEARHALTKNRLQDPNEFRVVSYNILADLYADSEYSRTVLFAHCPAPALEIEYRQQLLLKELLGYNADIICLQEVDYKEFSRVYEPVYTNGGGFGAIFHRKGGNVAEGEATFFRRDKFELVETHRTILSQLVEPEDQTIAVDDGNDDTSAGDQLSLSYLSQKPHPILSLSRDSPEVSECLDYFQDLRAIVNKKESLKARFCNRHTIIQVSLLKIKGTLDHLLVANTHLYFAPDADHIRLLQGYACTRYLEYIRDYYKRTFTSHNANARISIVLCGDMNSVPECGLYRLLTSGSASQDLPDWRSNEDETVEGTELRTDMKFTSAYKDIAYTNYTPGFNGCLDYIYLEDDLVCTEIVPLPDHADVIATGGIPSEVFPSDHLALVANLRRK